MTITPETAGSSSEGPAVGVCTKCSGPRDRKNSSYCKACRNEMAADYRLRTRPRPTTEERACALEGCDAIFTWRSTHPGQVYCSKSHYMKARHAASRGDRVDVPEGTLLCSLCKAVKPRADFPPSKQANKRTGWCRDCNVAKERDWARAHPEQRAASTRRSRAARLLRRYGAYSNDIDVITAHQGGLCIYCDQPPGVKGFHIEHDHEMHEAGRPSFRGLACHGCNVGIGALNDDPTHMRELADRLEVLKRELRG